MVSPLLLHLPAAPPAHQRTTQICRSRPGASDREAGTPSAMEPGLSIESGSAIRVAMLPVGGTIPPPRLREYAALVARHARVDLASLRTYYSEHQKSPFAHQPWETGCLRLKFVLGGCVPSPWEDFQSSRKVLAVIGICHLPSSPDLDRVAADFVDAARTYPSALARRCFAFCPTDAQMAGKKRDDIIMFPPSDQQSVELHMLTMIQDLAASLLMEFEKWVLRAESTGTILKTPLDSQSSLGSEEVIKAKKRRLGRAQKIIGDYCLLAGSPMDANAHYTTAIELARLTGDVFWHAGALEGSVCALVADRMGHSDPVLEDEVKYRYYTIIQLYRRATLQDNAQRVSPVSFELEAALKLARYLCRQELAKEVSDLLMGAADGAKALIDASDRLILYIEIARLFGTLGYKRKAAFFSRQVAQLYLQQDNAYAAMSAMQVLTMTTNAYHVQSRKTSKINHDSSKEPRASSSDSGKVHPQAIVSLFESQWSTLQMVVLREILMSSIRAADPLSSWSAAARLLRSFYPLITPAGQSGLASSLANSADKLPTGTRCADPCLPFIRLHSFPLHPSQRDIVKRNPGKKEWWTGAGPSGPFIYTPFSKAGASSGTSKQEVSWIVGEPVQVMVELANPCSFDLVIESIYLSVHSGNFDAFPVSVSLPPNTSKLVLLSGIPTQVGPISIPGCIVHCFGVITEHLFKEVDCLLLGAAQGLVLSDPFRCCGSSKFKSVNFPSISVVPPLPLLVANVVGGDGSILLYEGEIRDVLITLTNAGTVPVEEANIALSGKNQDSVISIAHSTWKSALPIKPGGEVTFAVTLRAWHLSSADLEADGSRSPASSRRIAREGINPFLNIHYAGPANPENGDISLPPGRRLVVPLNICVVQGMRLVRARLLSMEIPARFTEAHLRPVSGKDDISTGNDTERTNINLLKIDPYKGSWGLCLLELELFNPTDVVFDVDVAVHSDDTNVDQRVISEGSAGDAACHKTRIDRDYSARVLIPLENFKLPVLDASFFVKESSSDEPLGSRAAAIAERNAKAELNASINNLISKIKVKWHSGRNSSGELNIKDAIQAALQASIMDILLPDPLTFSFKLAKNRIATNADSSKDSGNPSTHSSDGNVGPSTDNVLRCDDPISAHAMTHMEVQIRNNTKEIIQMNLSISCKDVAGDNCFDENSATVLWAGVLSDIHLEVPPLQEVVHPFSVYFLVPGDYSLQASSVIIDATDVLRARAKAESPDEPILCRGSPFHIRVVGTA